MQWHNNGAMEWQRVVFSFEFQDGICPQCGEEDGECEFHAPTLGTRGACPYGGEATGGRNEGHELSDCKHRGILADVQ